jgi:hypothetical protein
MNSSIYLQIPFWTTNPTEASGHDPLAIQKQQCGYNVNL